MRRAPAPPPVLGGYTHVKHLASGGFADVHLYQQATTRRDVAVKVLLAEAVDEQVRRQFDDEANLMAKVSNHPSIVSVYEADIAPDGRPYIVMEYCSRPNLSVRYRTEPISVEEALRIGVRLASAVETAHRSGILHRDIKPENVLTTQYGWPALTDFGISAAAGPDADAALGMSVPWSPPETFGDPAVHDVRSDVWSLGATVYTLLARRSPFEVSGSGTDPHALIGRIERNPLPPLHRADVPAALEQSLVRAMAKHPAARYQTALELARAWQQVEISLQLAATSIDVLDATDAVTLPERDAVDGGTRIRGVTQIPAAAPTAPSPAAPAPRLPPTPPTVLKADLPVARPPAPVPVRTADLAGSVLPVPAASITVLRESSALPVDEPAEPARSGRRGLLLGAGVAVVLLAGAGAAVLAGADPPTGRPEPAAPSAEPTGGAVLLSVPAVSGLAGAVTPQGASFRWTNPAPEPGDSYLVRRTRPAPAGGVAGTDVPAAVVPGGAGTCVEVLLRRSNGRVSEPVEGCV